MKGKFQGKDEILIKASVDEVWNVLIDGTMLSQWMPMVKHTTSKVEKLNEIRYCDVEMNGKKGKVSEQCILYNEKKEIGWVMLTDEFGFGKMFDNFSFSFELIANNNFTKVIGRGYADPKHFIARIMNMIMMKRMSAKIRRQALGGIKKIAEMQDVN